MLNETGAGRRGANPAGTNRCWAALLACVVGAAAPAAAAASADGTYLWHGELVALDEAAGTVTIEAPVIAASGLQAAADVQAGEPIVITWSGFESRASGIRAVRRDDGAEPAASDAPEAVEAEEAAEAAAESEDQDEAQRFLLRARFVAVDTNGRNLTFEAALPAESLGTVRGLTRGAWVTGTSSHRPAESEAALLAVAPYSRSPERRPVPERGATYRWQGELLALDEAAGTLTVKSRAVSPSGLAAVADAEAGDRIVITWSGFENRASGIRAAMPDDGSGLWGSSRFLLEATFVEIDATGRYLTFKAGMPAESLSTVRGLTRGDWASVTSPHHPADGSPPVLSVDAYVPSRERRAAPLPGATYRWDGELVSLDEATGMLTVKSRVVSPAGLSAVAGVESGEPIVITWSGYESRASGIRAAMPDDGSGLWGSNRFLLRATLVEADAEGRYLTFEAPVPTASLSTVRALTRGSWATVRSPHHPADVDAAMLSVDSYAPSPERRPAPLPGATYRWDGEFVALDEATGMLTVKSRVASPSGLAAVAGSEAGEPIVITWSGYDSQANGIRAAMPDDGSGLWGSNRFLLRATFVEADAAGRYLTFRVAVPDDSLDTARALAQGTWASVTSPHHPADAAPAVMTVAAYTAAATSDRAAQ